ncbi:MAG: ion channel [Microcoleaceae cyanobacterium]
MEDLFVLLIGLIMFFLGQTIQAFVVSALIGILSRWLHSKQQILKAEHLLGRFIILSVTLFFLFINSLFQIGIWAAVFVLIGQFESYRTAFYHSAVNFATLGYGDMVMDDPWRMLGALEAISGVLMLGLSTATLSSVFGKLLQLHRQGRHHRSR